MRGTRQRNKLKAPVKMFLALITVPIDPKLIPAQIRLILLWLRPSAAPLRCDQYRHGDGLYFSHF